MKLSSCLITISHALRWVLKIVQEHLLRVCLHVPQMIVIIDWLIMCGSLVYVYRPIPVWIYFNSSAGGIFRWYVEIILVSIVCAIYCYNYIQWNKWHYKILWSLTFWSEINEGIFTSSSQVCVVVVGEIFSVKVSKHKNYKTILQETSLCTFSDIQGIVDAEWPWSWVNLFGGFF